MIPVHPDDPADPMDRAQRESTEYWNGYYQGKAAAMRNIGAIHRINLDQARRMRRRLVWAEAGFWLFASSSTATFLWALSQGTPPYWAWMMQGSTFTMVGTKLGYMVTRR